MQSRIRQRSRVLSLLDFDYLIELLRLGAKATFFLPLSALTADLPFEAFEIAEDFLVLADLVEVVDSFFTSFAMSNFCFFLF